MRSSAFSKKTSAMFQSVPVNVFSGLVAMIIMGLTAVIIITWSKHKNLKFVHVAQIKKIILYPVKSLRGVELEHVECTELGLRAENWRDRCFMIVKSGRNFVTQRQEPQLALLTPSLHGNQLHIDGPGMETLKLECLQKLNHSVKVSKCRIFQDSIETVDCGDEAAKWIQNFLKKDDFRFVQFLPDFRPRCTIVKMGFFHKPKQYSFALQDESAFSLLSEESVEDLNSRLSEKVSYRNFRPNFLIEHCQPYEEDNWTFIKMGEAIFYRVHHTSRCLVTTVNPDTGIKSNKEPLETLKTYRVTKDEKEKQKFGKTPILACSLGLEEKGEVHVGDKVFAVIDN
ncbi:mitochondrial amidoxime reducing component 2-like isoform X2 [Tachypleus tridentatus]|uniref:mitochondrial amidoxime reducing component 2-like isoform X2 n=1 Tax=Tachypleus tridentatus TaxID=6853 RepID=UPI003FD223B1